MTSVDDIIDASGFDDFWGVLPEEPLDGERDLARRLLSAEEGDEVAINAGDSSSETAVGYVEERPGCVEVRTERDGDLVFWVVRGVFVFVTSRDGKLLMCGPDSVADGGITIGD